MMQIKRQNGICLKLFFIVERRKIVRKGTIMRQKKQAVVDKNNCVACGSCQKVCPMGAIRVYKGLYARVDDTKCIGCGRCARECPASVIRLEVRHEE